MNWKKHLLSSSIPLEDSVSQILQQMGFGNLIEYNYLRKNKSEIDTDFSIDFSAEKHIEVKDNNAFYLNYLIECKYCSPGLNWIFMPNKLYENELSSFRIEDYDTNLEINYDYWETFPEYPIVGKGTELGSNGYNPNKITKAINQLSYAYINRYIDHIDHNNTIYCTYEKAFFIIPIIVTTADLWKIKTGTTIQMIESSTNMSDIAEPHDVLLYNYLPDNMMQKELIEKLKSLDCELLNKLEDKIRTNYSAEEHIESHFEDFALMNPSSLIIINYNAFEKEFNKLNDFLCNKNLVKKRSK